MPLGFVSMFPSPTLIRNTEAFPTSGAHGRRVPALGRSSCDRPPSQRPRMSVDSHRAGLSPRIPRAKPHAVSDGRGWLDPQQVPDLSNRADAWSAAGDHPAGSVAASWRRIRRTIRPWPARTPPRTPDLDQPGGDTPTYASPQPPGPGLATATEQRCTVACKGER